MRIEPISFDAQSVGSRRGWSSRRCPGSLEGQKGAGPGLDTRLVRVNGAGLRGGSWPIMGRPMGENTASVAKLCIGFKTMYSTIRSEDGIKII